MSRKRFVLECVWSGYRPSQSRVCHRAVVTNFVDALKKVHTIGFTDGTTMSVTVRECLPREKVTRIPGYTNMLYDVAILAYQGKISGYVNTRDLP